MSITLTWAKVKPFLPTMSTEQEARVQAWLPVLQLRLNARYGDRITPENESAFVSAAADSIMTRLARPGGQIDSQTIGPANVRYNNRAALLKWFLPEQLDDLDAIVGLGNIRSVRTPAPDGIRFGNRLTRSEEDLDGLPLR